MISQIASPDFEAALKTAAIGLCRARGIDPDALESSNQRISGQRPAWENAAYELRNFWLLMTFAKTLPPYFIEEVS